MRRLRRRPELGDQLRVRIMNASGDRVGPQSQYDGDRDIFAAAGYNPDPTNDDMLVAMAKLHIARRLVAIFPQYTWRLSPVVRGIGDEDGSGEFATAWEKAWKSGQILDNGDTRLGLSFYLPAFDTVSLSGKFAVLFLSFADDQNLETPVNPGSLSDPEDLVYVSIYAEANTKIKYDTDPKSPRFGQPDTYELTSNVGGKDVKIGPVHWTRCIHVAQNGLGSRVEGHPLLENVYHLLQDILKVTSSSGEGAWRTLDPGVIVTSQPNFEAPAVDAWSEALGELEEDTDTMGELTDSLRNWVNGLERFLISEGFDVEVLDGSITDPTPTLIGYIKLIAGATGIPLRLLLGNEAGELASSQDERNWADVIMARQTQVIEPLLLRPVINRLIWAGALPDSGEGYTVEWNPLHKIDASEQVAIAEQAARALEIVGADVDPKVFVATFLPMLPADSIGAVAVGGV